MDSFALLLSSRFSTSDRWSWRVTALAFPMRIFNSLFYLPSLVNETPSYLNFSDCFSRTPPIWREHCMWCLFALSEGTASVVCTGTWSIFLLYWFSFRQQSLHPKTCQELAGDHFRSSRSYANNRRFTVQSPIFTPSQNSLFSAILLFCPYP